MSEPVALHATHTHLFAGARLTAADGRFPADPRPVRIIFRDDAEADAEMLPGEADGELHLTVDAHRTAAGHHIPAKRWRIRRVETDAAGAETGVVGTRMACRCPAPRRMRESAATSAWPSGWLTRNGQPPQELRGHQPTPPAHVRLVRRPAGPDLSTHSGSFWGRWRGHRLSFSIVAGSARIGSTSTRPSVFSPRAPPSVDRSAERGKKPPLPCAPAHET
jgi:hypothetical protein